MERYADEAAGPARRGDRGRDPRPDLVAELERAGRALEMVDHGCDDPGHRVAARARELEAQTSIKRGYLNLLHAREAIGRTGHRGDRAGDAGPAAALQARRPLTVRRPADRWSRPHHVVVSSAHTTSPSGAELEDLMRCPQCGERETRVVDSRDLDDSATIRRRRECAACATRFTTYERVEAARLVVVKRDGTRQEFDRDKLASGLRKALTRRPVPDGSAEPAADEIEAELRAAGAGEVPTSRVGRAGDGQAPRDRPDRLHPVRQRLPELRGPRGPQARGRHPVRDARPGARRRWRRARTATRMPSAAAR